MAGELKPCPFCGNEHPEIASGDSVICNTDGHTGCGCSAFYDRWNERTPGPATKKMLEVIELYRVYRTVSIDELWDVSEAFLSEWRNPAATPAPDVTPLKSSPWKCCICGKPVRIADDLRPHHVDGPTNHEAELSNDDLKILADGLRLTD